MTNLCRKSLELREMALNRSAKGKREKERGGEKNPES